MCYRIAYFALPQLLFADAPRTIGYFHHDTIPEGAFIYVMCAKVLNVEMVRLHATMFHAHSGELSDGKNYYILQYPESPPFERSDHTAPLAPFFSAIVQQGEDVSYYVLGQSPSGGTTFRTVMRDGANVNLGEGPAPELSAFLDFLRNKADDAKPVAAFIPNR